LPRSTAAFDGRAQASGRTARQIRDNFDKWKEVKGSGYV
jgi:hypothetical protein